MENKPTAKRSGTGKIRSDSSLNTDIHKRSMDAVPRWSLALCAVILVLSFAIRQIGLDITTPINRIMSAYAVRIESESASMSEGRTNSKQISELQHELQQMNNQLVSLGARIDKLEQWSHPPGKKKK